MCFRNVHPHELLNSDEERRKFKVVGPLSVFIGGGVRGEGIEFGGLNLGIIYSDPGIGLEIRCCALGGQEENGPVDWWFSPRLIFMKEISFYKSKARPPSFIYLVAGALPFVHIWTMDPFREGWSFGMEAGIGFLWPFNWVKEEDEPKEWFRRLNPILVGGIEIKYKRLFSLPEFAENNLNTVYIEFVFENMFLPLK